MLVVKPLDVNLDRADTLIAECEQGVKLGVFFQDRVAPGICKLKELIDAGRLGTLILVSVRVKWYRPPEYYTGSSWRGTWALDGGGALINQGVHTLDLLLWLLGDVERVYAKAITALHQIETEDSVVATLEFVSRVIGTLEASTSIYPGYPRRLELTPSEGTLVLAHDRIIAADLRRPLEEEALGAKEDPNPCATCGFRRSRASADPGGLPLAIETDGRPLRHGHEGRRSLELVQAIYQSSLTGLSVTLV